MLYICCFWWATIVCHTIGYDFSYIPNHFRCIILWTTNQNINPNTIFSMRIFNIVTLNMFGVSKVFVVIKYTRYTFMNDFLYIGLYQKKYFLTFYGSLQTHKMISLDRTSKIDIGMLYCIISFGEVC